MERRHKIFIDLGRYLFISMRKNLKNFLFLFLFFLSVKEVKGFAEVDFYAYPKGKIDYKERLLTEKKDFRVYQLFYPSCIDTGYKDNYIYLEYYQPKKETKSPLILILPHLSGESIQIERFFAHRFAQNGFACLILETGLQRDWQKAKKWLKEEIKREGMIRLIPLFRQIVIEAQRALDIFEEKEEIDREKIGILGISLGGIVSPIVAGIDKRIKAGVYLLGGGNIVKLIKKSRLLKRFRKYLKEEEILNLIDPLNFSSLAKEKPTLMLNAWFDRDIPKECTLELWEALGKPKIIWLPTSHYSAIFFIGYARIMALQHFRNVFLEKTAEKEKRFSFSSTAVEPFKVRMENLFGHKEKLSVSGKISERENRLKIGIEKSFDDYFLGTQISGRSWDDERFSLLGKGIDLYLGKILIDFLRINLRYHFENVEVYHLKEDILSDFTRYRGNNQISSLSLNLDYTVLDEPKYPQEGTHNALSLEIAGKALGGESNFLRILGESSWYFTPFSYFTFVFHLKGGWIEDLGSSSDIPFFERFYAGGSSSIRGYRSRYVGPQDNQEKPLGGEILFVSNFEMRFPIYKKISGAGFFDIGNVWKKDDFKWGGFKSGVGLGIRYKLNLGIVRLDYGFGLDPDLRKKNGALTLTLGLPF